MSPLLARCDTPDTTHTMRMTWHAWCDAHKAHNVMYMTQCTMPCCIVLCACVTCVTSCTSHVSHHLHCVHHVVHVTCTTSFASCMSHHVHHVLHVVHITSFVSPVSHRWGGCSGKISAPENLVPQKNKLPENVTYSGPEKYWKFLNILIIFHFRISVE